MTSTGTSFCYNVGRFIAATGPFTFAVLKSGLEKSALGLLPPEADAAAKALAKIGAFRDACTWVSLVFLLGLVVVFFLPETKDRDLNA